jgi:hypothetical protein
MQHREGWAEMLPNWDVWQVCMAHTPVLTWGSMETEHIIKAKHCTNFKNTMLLPKMAHYIHHIETLLHSNNFNTDMTLTPSWSWNLATYTNKAEPPKRNRRKVQQQLPPWTVQVNSLMSINVLLHSVAWSTNILVQCKCRENLWFCH